MFSDSTRICPGIILHFGIKSHRNKFCPENPPQTRTNTFPAPNIPFPAPEIPFPAPEIPFPAPEIPFPVARNPSPATPHTKKDPQSEVLFQLLNLIISYPTTRFSTSRASCSTRKQLPVCLSMCRRLPQVCL